MAPRRTHPQSEPARVGSAREYKGTRPGHARSMTSRHDARVPSQGSWAISQMRTGIVGPSGKRPGRQPPQLSGGAIVRRWRERLDAVVDILGWSGRHGSSGRPVSSVLHRPGGSREGPVGRPIVDAPSDSLYSPLSPSSPLFGALLLCASAPVHSPICSCWMGATLDVNVPTPAAAVECRRGKHLWGIRDGGSATSCVVLSHIAALLRYVWPASEPIQ